ncbi:PREDICTED: proton extrusion protein PcxA isoform X2 [Nelumbo nucifera]|uniref:Proton extrusion protein PcxA isoform X2 n=1 Tax=Nelumbo nucifera TaxID=4432 RepID=A0A1U8BAW8_NELNU|nr:PREDICTED: proton extrusion protein PcxA isoform X2 [Nelumbo nucifera]
MSLMSTSMVLAESFIACKRSAFQTTLPSRNTSNSVVLLAGGRRRLRGLIPNARNGHSGKRTWWQKFFIDEDGNWFGFKEDDLLQDPESSGENKLSEGEKFEAWKRRAEAITELREAQKDMRNAASREWEDWLVEGTPEDDSSSWVQDWSDGLGESRDDIPVDQSEMIPEKGFVDSVRDLVLGKEDDDLLYEDRVFQYASSNSAKFLAVLVVIPWTLDFLVHDYVLMPFLDRYVKTVPLAAEMLDVRRNQKLEMIKALKVEKARFRFEVEIGKSPPLSDEEAWLELRHKALELRDEWRLENRRAFANIWSDMVFGITLFILLYFNQSKVALLKFTGYKLINNISDTGKAFLIILITDIFLGYHSESGWQTLLEIIVEHYGFEVDQSVITIFVCLVPVVIDACVKLWDLASGKMIGRGYMVDGLYMLENKDGLQVIESKSQSFIQIPSKIVSKSIKHFQGNEATLVLLFGIFSLHPRNHLARKCKLLLWKT